MGGLLTAVLVRPNPLIPILALLPQDPDIRILDNLELMLLVLVKVPVERVRGQLDRLGDQTGKKDGDVAHLAHVFREGVPEPGQHLLGRPLVRPQQVVVQGGCGRRRRVLGREVDLLAVVDGAGGYLGREARVA